MHAYKWIISICSNYDTLYATGRYVRFIQTVSNSFNESTSYHDLEINHILSNLSNVHAPEVN